MWKHRVLSRARRLQERGSAVVESIFAILILLILVLGTIEVAFALYAGNVVAAAAHEGARAGIELGRSPDDAAAIASSTVRRATGGLVDDLDVDTVVQRKGTRALVTVRVTGVMKPFGPVPLPIPLSSTALVTREVRVR
jgi:Flp pilus assembly protein TadG